MVNIKEPFQQDTETPTHRDWGSRAALQSLGSKVRPQSEMV